MSAQHPPDHAEREHALDIGYSTLVIAPAGSGKTSLLVARALKCLAVSKEPEEVVALTFTNKAAAEIRTRLLQALQLAQGPVPDKPHDRQLHELASHVLEHARARGWQLLENPNRLRAMTIDALNAELAGRLPLLSGLGGPASMTEDGDGLFAETIQCLFEELEDPDLPEEVRAALAEVLRAEDNRLDRLVSPLSGMLQKREQWLKEILDQCDPAQDARLLGALLESRMRALDTLLEPSSKDALSALLREGSGESELLAWAKDLEVWPVIEAAQLPLWRRLANTLVTGQGSLRKEKGINKTQGFIAGRPYTQQMKQLLRDLDAHPRRAELEAACATLSACPDPAYPEHLRRRRDALARVLVRLEQHLRVVFSRRGEADFTQVALSALDALGNGRNSSELLERIDARIRHLLVDEMQDTSESQVGLLKLLTSGWVPGDGHSLFMVGDPQQSIYAFRKAEVRLFLELWDRRRLGDVPLQCIRLSTNFRSAPALIDWFNRSFTAIFPAESDVYSGAVAYSPCASLHPAGGDAAAVRIRGFHDGDEHAEARAVVARVTELLAGDGSIAILARSRAQLWHTLAELRRQGVAYSCQDIDPLRDVPAVREFLHLARALWHAEDRLAWAVLLRSPLVGMSYADLLALSRGRTRLPWPERIRSVLAEDEPLSGEGRQRLRHLADVLAQADADPLLHGNLAARAEAVWHALGGPACVTLQELADLRSAMRRLRELAASGEIESLAALERALQQVYAMPGNAPGSERVQVLTAHKSKGLEFDHVLLVGCGESTRQDDRPALHYHRTAEGVLLVPQPASNLPDDDPAWRLYDFVQGLQREAAGNELLRLLYVCCTRARRTLSLFMSLSVKDGEARARAGSFARLLWPVIGEQYQDMAGGDNPQPEPSLRLPLSPRLPTDYRFVVDDPAWRPRERRSLRPSEAALEAQEGKPREGDLYAQLVGTMYHEAMRRIAHDGLDRWQDAGESRRSAMASGFRHLGLPEPQVARAVDHVLRLLRTTLVSEHGRWLLAPREWAQAEYALAGYRDGEWVSAIVDRCFEENGQVWVIDYKTTSASAEVARREHGAQLHRYAELLAAARTRPVRAALFLAESGELVEIGPTSR